jgi:hypothetical protein
MPLALSKLQRSGPIIILEVDVTARSNELFRDIITPSSGSEVERRAPILHLKVDATARSNQLFRDGLMPI